jgi:D-3-phosphoglycerate dehydrogenase
MKARRVVVTQRLFDAATIAYLEAQGCEVVLAEPPPGRGDGDLTQPELEALLAGAAGWIVGHARVTGDLLAALPDLQIISRRGVGYERVDLEAARNLGKVVAIAAGGNDASVADHAIALMLAVGRRFRESQARMLAGDWTILTGSDLYRKTVGVVGAGRSGRSLVQRLRGFEADILVHGRSRDEAWAAENGVTYVEMPHLLARSDYVTLHAPLTPATRLLIDADAMAAMKPGAVLINTARGGLVDDRALLAALSSGHLGGAGLDTFMSESDPEQRPVTEALLALPNVVATPHAAASSREGLDRTNMVAARSVVAVLDGGDPAQGCVVADGRRQAVPL